MIQNMPTFYFKSSKQCYFFNILHFFEFFISPSWYRKGVGLTPYSPRGEVFSSDYVALVIDYHKNVSKPQPYLKIPDSHKINHFLTLNKSTKLLN